MTYSANDYAADTLAVTLETLEEALDKTETDEEHGAVVAAIEEVETARDLVLERESPTPTQQLVERLQARAESSGDSDAE